jgi:hypothetical protein
MVLDGILQRPIPIGGSAPLRDPERLARRQHRGPRIASANGRLPASKLLCDGMLAQQVGDDIAQALPGHRPGRS